LFNAPPRHALYTLSLHDALPISEATAASGRGHVGVAGAHAILEPKQPVARGRADARRQPAHADHVLEEPPLHRPAALEGGVLHRDRKSTRLNSSHDQISYAVFCL